jgi:hypothetical protein
MEFVLGWECLGGGLVDSLECLLYLGPLGWCYTVTVVSVRLTPVV